MALFVVATPIGNPEDFSMRALATLRDADLIIGEELKVLRQILKAAGVQNKPLDQLNEHSDAKDIQYFVEECRNKKVALVSDCGTPGFCDPGADLVEACHQAKVPVHGLPGASSLMVLLSVAGQRVDKFVFYGFLPAKQEDRARALKELASTRQALVLMETPYRCQKLFQDLSDTFANRFCVVGLNLTQENERVYRGKGKEVAKALADFSEAEPIVLVMP